MRRLAVPMLAAFALAGCGGTPAAPEVRDAWVRLAPLAERPAAAYFTIAGGAEPERLIGVQSDAAQRIELHQGGMHGGMTTMRPLGHVDVPAGGTAAFAPGGNHAMLFGVAPAVKPATTVRLRFRFASGKTIEADARTVAVGDPAPGG